MGAPFAVVVLYKNILFFLVPIWFGAAQFPSLNMGVPLLLAAMALGTCFASQYQHRIIEHPVRRVLWSAVVLFAALVPALEVMAFASPRVSLFIAALLSAAVATAALRSDGESILSRRALGGILAGAIPVALLVVLAAPLLPPVPADCLDKGAGTAIANRNLIDRAEAFPRGTHRVYAWFAVSLPARYRQQVIFKWFHDGAAVGAPIVTTIEGGRSGGYRTATSRSRRRLAAGAPTCSTKRASWSRGSTSTFCRSRVSAESSRSVRACKRARTRAGRRHVDRYSCRRTCSRRPCRRRSARRAQTD